MIAACRLGAHVFICALLLAACQSEPSRPVLTPSPSGGLPVEIQAVLYGDETPCRSGEDCLSGQCLYSRCSGLTRADEPWRTEIVVDRLLGLLANDKGLVDKVAAEIAGLVMSGDLSLPTRARFVWALERLGGLGALRRLDAAFDGFPEQIQVVVAAARLRLGDPTHADLVLAQTDSDRPGLRIEAVRALGGCGACPAETKALVHARLLGAVFGEVEHEEARAALDALVKLNDRATIAPIIALLENGPEALRDPAAIALATMSGVRHGRNLEAWKAWATKANLPPSPSFAPIERRTEDDIGLPEP